MRILIIIPAYNEQESIRYTIEDIRNNIRALRDEIDYIVIDDCSTDSTKEILQSDGIPYLSLCHNLGIGGGVQTGYLYAYQMGYDIAVQFDGDGQHQAKYLQTIIEPIIDGEADYVIGSRFISDGGFQSSWTRRIGISILRRTIKLVCGEDIHDVTSGMRAVNRDIIALFAKRYAQDYAEPEAILMAKIHGARIREVSVQMTERKGGHSSINALRSTYYMFKVSISLVLTKFISGKEK